MLDRLTDPQFYTLMLIFLVPAIAGALGLAVMPLRRERTDRGGFR